MKDDADIDDQEFEVLSPAQTKQDFSSSPQPRFNTFSPLPSLPIPYPMFLDQETCPPLPVPIIHSRPKSTLHPKSFTPEPSLKPIDLFLHKIQMLKTFQSNPAPRKRQSIPRHLSSSLSIRDKMKINRENPTRKPKHQVIILKPQPVITSSTKLVETSYQINDKSIPSAKLHSSKFSKRYMSMKTISNREKELKEAYLSGGRNKKKKKGLPRVSLVLPDTATTMITTTITMGVREIEARGVMASRQSVDMLRLSLEKKRSVCWRKNNLVDKVIEDLIENPKMVKAGILSTFK